MRATAVLGECPHMRWAAPVDREQFRARVAELGGEVLELSWGRASITGDPRPEVDGGNLAESVGSR